jgi:hypothetical protein
MKGGMLKMKKKIMAVVAALAIMTVGTTAFAAESPSAGETDAGTKDASVAATVTAEAPAETPEQMAKDTTATATAADGTVLQIVSNAVAKDTPSEATTAAQAAVNKLTDLATLLGSNELATAAKDSTKKVVAEVKTVVNLDVVNGSITSPTAIKISHKSIEAGKTYFVLHYTNGAWQQIKATDVQTGSLVITVDSLSPIAIVEVSVEETAKTPNPTLSTDNKVSAAAKTGNSAAAADSTADADASPKTGETTPLALIGLMVCVAGAFACTKKSQRS